jgi:hypothetical protein
VRPRRPPATLADWVDLGIAVQRIWLTATQQGLHLQPQMTPVIFRWYARAGRRFSTEAQLGRQALDLATEFEHLVGATQGDAFGFFARVGECHVPDSRSIRRDLSELLKA